MKDIETRRCPACGRFGTEDGVYAPMIGKQISETSSEDAELRVFCSESCFDNHSEGSK